MSQLAGLIHTGGEHRRLFHLSVMLPPWQEGQDLASPGAAVPVPGEPWPVPDGVWGSLGALEECLRLR